MKDSERMLAERMTSALNSYLDGSGETALHAAYELGRDALGSGLGLLSHATMLDRALLMAVRDRPEGAADVIERAEPFLIEAFSPFEMAQRAVRDTNAVLRRLDRAREEEVKRLAHELHDEAGQMLAVVHLDLDRVANELPPGFRDRLEPVRARLRDVELQLRRISHEMRPTALDDLGLLPALRFLGEGVARRASITVRVEDELDRRLSPEVETVLYRAVQEALTNVARHAEATRVTVRLEHEDGLVVLSVTDDGVGFDPGRAGDGAGLGITGMRERLASIGGTLEIRSTPGKGTMLRAPIPLVEHAAHSAGR
jgi:signal transduction histidine kinase